MMTKHFRTRSGRLLTALCSLALATGVLAKDAKSTKAAAAKESTVASSLPALPKELRALPPPVPREFVHLAALMKNLASLETQVSTDRTAAIAAWKAAGQAPQGQRVAKVREAEAVERKAKASARQLKAAKADLIEFHRTLDLGVPARLRE